MTGTIGQQQLWLYSVDNNNNTTKEIKIMLLAEAT